jgi:tetratricopeptide (TPR) repeat protein
MMCEGNLVKLSAWRGPVQDDDLVSVIEKPGNGSVFEITRMNRKPSVVTPPPGSPATREAGAAALHLLEDAIRLHQAGRLDEAKPLYERILVHDPGDADSLHLLGVIAYQAGDDDAAIDLIRKAIAVRRNVAAYHSNLGNVFLRQGRLDMAAACFRRAIGLKREYPEAHNNLGLALSGLGKRDEAVACYRKAIGYKPDYVNAHNNLGAVLLDLGRPDDAAVCCRDALDLDPGFAPACNNLGNALRDLGHLEDAVDLYRRAVQLKPDYGDAHNNLGFALQHQGRFVEAFAAHEVALRSGADRPTSYYGLSSCRKFIQGDLPLAADIEALLEDSALSASGQSLLHFALGKIRDDLSDYGAAIRNFDAANRLERASRRLDPAGLPALVERAIERSKKAPQSDSAASGSKLPIFIVGMPRSGTTLTEQILANHHKIAAGGEIDFWLRGSGKPGMPEPDAVRDYLGLLTRLSFGAARVTDKMPFNFLFLDRLQRLFPNARIVHCRRNPVDTALSIYFTRFSPSTNFAQISNFAYDRGDIVRAYRAYLRLMEHWRGVLSPDRFIEIDYEALVADPETVARRLVAFCDLEWDRACLDFHRANRPIGTASAWQARQPIYRTSVERWRNYEPGLGELRELLG